MMMTFSMSAMLWVLPVSGRFTLYSTDTRTGVTRRSGSTPLLRPPRHRTTQLEIGDRGRGRGQVEPEEAVRQPRPDNRVLGLPAEGHERADHPAVHAPDAAGQRQQVGEHPHEVAHDDDRPRRRLAERLE